MDFNILWRYFAWCNQTLAVFTLWAITVYLSKEKKFYGVSLIPALFMTAVAVSYILMASEGFHLSQSLSVSLGVLMAIVSLTLFYKNKIKKCTLKFYKL
jgi:carbon starvation protein CstA